MENKQSIEQASQFLTLLDETTDRFTFQLFSDNKEWKDKYEKDPLAIILHGTIDDLFDDLCKYNNLGAGIFVMVNAGDFTGRNNKSVNRVRCVFQELDNGIIKNATIEPQLTIESSKGKYHKYWLCDGLSFKEYDSVLARMVAEYGSDGSATGLARVLRVPGFYHLKDRNNPFLVSIYAESGGQNYTREQILEAFPPLVINRKIYKPLTNFVINDKTEQTCIDRITSIFDKTGAGNRHKARLSASILAGGFIAGGLLDENIAINVLFNLSDKVSDKGTTKTERNTIFTGIGYGKEKPIREIFTKKDYERPIEVSNQEETEHYEAQEWKPSLSGDIDYIIPFDCLARDIQQWILSISVKPQPAIAFAATIAILSAVSGRGLRCDGTKGNIMSLCLAESGEGKDKPLKSIKNIMEAIGLGDSLYGHPASGAALIDIIADEPSALLAIDEVGHYFAGINSKSSSQYSREIMPLMTEIYTCAADSYREKKRKGQDSRLINEPNLSVIGMTTEKQIMDALRSSEVADGSLARFFIVFGLDNVRINRNRVRNQKVPEHIIKGLEAIKTNQFMSSSQEIEISDEYFQYKCDLEDFFTEKGIKLWMSGGDKAMFKPFVFRVAVRSIQMALLIDGCKSIDVLKWCADINDKSCDIFVKKFCHLSADNDNERFVKIIERAIKEAGKNGISKNQLYHKTRQVNVTMSKAILAHMIESDAVFTREMKLNGSQRSSIVYFWKK